MSIGAGSIDHQHLRLAIASTRWCPATGILGETAFALQLLTGHPCRGIQPHYEGKKHLFEKREAPEA